jgi:hypothetical protein
MRGAAEANGVAHSTLSRRIKRVANATPTETQASTEVLERDGKRNPIDSAGQAPLMAAMTCCRAASLTSAYRCS